MTMRLDGSITRAANAKSRIQSGRLPIGAGRDDRQVDRGVEAKSDVAVRPELDPARAGAAARSSVDCRNSSARSTRHN